MKKISYIIFASAFIFSALSAIPALAASAISAGNDTTNRTQLDSRSNFVVIDKNHPVSADGLLNNFRYYAGNTNSFRFIVVDGSNTVKYISPQIIPSSAGVGVFKPAQPVNVSAGWNVGFYFPSSGTIPFEATGASAPYTLANSGQPSVGETMAFESSAPRTYSFLGGGKTTETAPALNDKKIEAGNDSNSRTQLDTYGNFPIIDTNHPISGNGELKKFTYWAANKNPFRFLLVDNDGKVSWASEPITPKKIGKNIYRPSAPIVAKKGWNIGLYFAQTGTIPFETAGKEAKYSANNSGFPPIGSTVSITGTANRTYSFSAVGKADKIKKEKDCQRRCGCNCESRPDECQNNQDTCNWYERNRIQIEALLKMLRNRCR